MTLGALGIDLYQITTLLAHADMGLLHPKTPEVGMRFFFRQLPKHRNYVVTAGLRSIIEFITAFHMTQENWLALQNHPLLKKVWLAPYGRYVQSILQELQGFVGEMEALPEGTLAFAGPAFLQNGQPVCLEGQPFWAQTPLLQLRTDLVRAKLLETPLVSRLNFFSMVASKAARIVQAARFDGMHRPVFEFGQRRTHPEAAVDAAYAAYLAGCDATSNVAATQKYGIPSVGTMDHFSIQALEKQNVPTLQTEGAFFAKFCEIFPQAATLLVDTYETFAGIEDAVRSTHGKLTGVRLDSNVTPKTVKQAKQLLQQLGAAHTKVFVSDSLEEWRVQKLAKAGADGFGVGEHITCSPDAATGIGAVGKLVTSLFGKPSMKAAYGSNKTSIPGMIQAYRFSGYDFLTIADEPAPAGGMPLLQKIWRGKDRAKDFPSLESSRAYVQEQIELLPPALRNLEPIKVTSPAAWRLVLSDELHQLLQETALAAKSPLKK